MRKLSKLAFASGVLAGLAGPAAAEVQLGFNLGWNDSFSSDVRFTGPGATDFTVQDIPWEGQSLGSGGAPYYGVRATYWFDEGPGWGLMLDFTHAKIRAEGDANVALIGTTGASGVVPETYPVAALFDRLEMTDGINFLTLNALYRFTGTKSLQPYVGVGAGLTRPHVEVTGNSLSALPATFGYEFGGFTAQALAGVNWRLTDLFSVYGEYRMNYSPVDAPLADSAFEIETDLFTNQLLFGVSVHFGR